MGDDEATMEGVEGAAEFGAEPLLSTLLSLAAYDYPEAIQHRLLDSAIMSDCALTCAAVMGLVSRPLPEAIIASARQRGNTRVLQLLTGEGMVELEASCREVRDNMESAGVDNKVPKTTEFSYGDKPKKVKKFLINKFAPFAMILCHLHLPKVHYQLEEASAKDCHQTNVCHRVRATYGVVKTIVNPIHPAPLELH